MELLNRAAQLLTRYMGEESRKTWLTLAFHANHREVYDAIELIKGATSDFVPHCVAKLLDLGCVKPENRHALSLLLEEVAKNDGEGKQQAFRQLIAELDASCIRPPDPNNPYRDLLAFQEEDAPYFFGRETFTQELAEALDRRPFVAVIGPSGSGKSSVAMAGLIPRLRARGDWAIGIFRPGKEPFRSLAGCLLNLLRGEPDASAELKRLEQIGRLAAYWCSPAAGDCGVPLRQMIERIVGKHPGTSRLLLLVDQWEELYTYKSPDSPSTRFTDLLLEAVQDAPLGIVLTLRADFTGHALEHRSLRDRLQEATVYLGPMNRDELEQAVQGPARLAGVGF